MIITPEQQADIIYKVQYAFLHPLINQYNEKSILELIKLMSINKAVSMVEECDLIDSGMPDKMGLLCSADKSPLNRKAFWLQVKICLMMHRG